MVRTIVTGDRDGYIYYFVNVYLYDPVVFCLFPPSNIFRLVGP